MLRSIGRPWRYLAFVTVAAMVLSFVPSTAFGAPSLGRDLDERHGGLLHGKLLHAASRNHGGELSTGADVIAFNISPSGPKTISVGSGSINPFPL